MRRGDNLKSYFNQNDWTVVQQIDMFLLALWARLPIFGPATLDAVISIGQLGRKW